MCFFCIKGSISIRNTYHARINIQICKLIIAIVSTGGFSAADFIKEVGRNAAREAVMALFDFIGLSDKVSLDEMCDEQAIVDSRGGKLYCLCHLSALAVYGFFIFNHPVSTNIVERSFSSKALMLHFNKIGV